MINIIIGNGPFACELAAYTTMYTRNEVIFVSKVISEYTKKLGIKFITVSNLLDINFGDKLDNNFGNIYLGSGKPLIKQKMYQEIIDLNISNISWGSNIIMGISLSNNHNKNDTIIAPNAVVSINVELGNHVLINYCASVGHDTKIGDFSSVGPNASIGGCCDIGNGVMIGAGANIKENIKIGDNATIGMGAVVIRNVESGDTVVGVPAKVLECKPKYLE